MHAIIIQGNPLFITSDLARQYYTEISDYLLSLGVKKITLDPGIEYTTPDPRADFYIGHSRGVGRLRFVPKEKKSRVLMFGVPGGIIHPKDLADQRRYPPPRPANRPPVAEHFLFTKEQQNAIKDMVNTVSKQKPIYTGW